MDEIKREDIEIEVKKGRETTKMTTTLPQQR
jgi:hypothetical protein